MHFVYFVPFPSLNQNIEFGKACKSLITKHLFILTYPLRCCQNLKDPPRVNSSELRSMVSSTQISQQNLQSHKTFFCDCFFMKEIYVD